MVCFRVPKKEPEFKVFLVGRLSMKGKKHTHQYLIAIGRDDEEEDLIMAECSVVPESLALPF